MSTPNSSTPKPITRVSGPPGTWPPRSSTAWRGWKRRTSLGNDVVWLGDPHNQGRFADLALLRRVLTVRERLLVQVSPEPDRMLWSLWAAKEASWKAWSRDHRGQGFSPQKWEVHWEPQGGPTHVHFAHHEFPVVWKQGPDWVHAWVSDPGVVAQVSRRTETEDEGVAVRSFAVQALVAAGYVPGVVEGVPPVYRTGTDLVPVSLSHDGPYVAVAFPSRSFRP